MYSSIDLRPNRGAVLADVILADGRYTQLRIEPNHAWIDSRGYVRLFTMEWRDGSAENFKLLPRNSNSWSIGEEIVSFLAIFGLARGAGRLLSQAGKLVQNLAVFIVNKHGASIVIQDIFSREEIKDSAYYCVETGELWISHPIVVG